MVSLSKYFKILLFLTLLSSFSVPAQAEVEDGVHVSEAVVGPLMAWVEAKTGYKVTVLPDVIASRSQFKAVLRKRVGAFAGQPQSLYIPGTVLLNNLTWDEEDPTALSLLVHELVHHNQLFMPGQHWACADAKETQAYNLQNEWLAEHGHQPFVQAAFIEQVSNCPNSTGLQLAQSSPDK